MEDDVLEEPLQKGAMRRMVSRGPWDLYCHGAVDSS